MNSSRDWRAEGEARTPEVAEMVAALDRSLDAVWPPAGVVEALAVACDGCGWTLEMCLVRGQTHQAPDMVTALQDAGLAVHRCCHGCSHEGTRACNEQPASSTRGSDALARITARMQDPAAVAAGTYLAGGETL